MVTVTTKKKAKKATRKTTVGSNGAAKKKMTKAETMSRRIVGMTRKKIVSPNANSWGMLVADIKSTAQMMMHQFSDKLRKQLEDKHAGVPTGKRPPKNKEADFFNAMHVIGKRPKTRADLKKTKFGIPAVTFKNAMTAAAKKNGIAMTDFRTMIRIESDDGNLVAITASIPTLDSRWARNDNGNPDIRHRPIFADWSANLRIWFNARMITAEQVAVILEDAGAGGVGELRPCGKKSSGDLGTFRVVKAYGDVPEFE